MSHDAPELPGHAEAAPHAAEVEKILGHRERHPISEFVRNSPFLCASLALHIVVLTLLAFVTANQPVEVRRRITIRLEDLTSDEVRMQPLQREENLASLSSGLTTLVGAEGEDYNTATTSSARVEIPRVSILGLMSSTRTGSEDDWERDMGEGLRLAPGKGSGSAGGAVDQFAVVTLNCMMQGKTLVVLMIDRSASVLYGPLPEIITRMDHYFDEIKNNLPEEVEEKARWVVVSYGKAPNFECQPSADLEYIKNALRGVTSDRSGVENLGLALEAVLDRFANTGYKYLLIAAMTDEAGDDVNNPVVLERAIKRIREAKGRFFVFGYESIFCARKKPVTISAAQFKGQDRAEYEKYAKATGKKLEEITISGLADAGPECPMPELWWAQTALPSGFGMYALNRMALATDGIYFLLKPESKYNEEKLYAKYKPDICSVFAYRERLSEVPLRRKLVELWAQFQTNRFPLGEDLRSAQQVQQVLDTSVQARGYYTAQAGELRQLLDTSPPVGDTWSRWEAHGELTLATLLVNRFVVGQYHEVVRRGWDKIEGAVPPKKRLVVRTGQAPKDFVGPEAAKAEYDTALGYIERMVEKHKGTPWETLAAQLKGSLHPWTCALEDIPASSPPSPGKPTTATPAVSPPPPIAP
jgi:hypothetical protein